MIKKQDSRTFGRETLPRNDLDGERFTHPSIVYREKNFCLFGSVSKDIQKNDGMKMQKHYALDFMDELDDDDNHLFSYDLNDRGAKGYIVSTREKMYHYIKKDRKIPYGYENYEAHDPVKLFLDIDLSLKDYPKSKDKIDKAHLNYITDKATKLLNEELVKYTDVKPQIIILESMRKDKLSAHIIYSNIYFRNVYRLGEFLHGLDPNKLERLYIDMAPYRVGCFRMMHCTKIGKRKTLELYKTINYQKTEEKDIFMDSLLTNINDDAVLIDHKPKLIKKIECKKNSIIKRIINETNDKKGFRVTYNAKTIETYLNMMRPKRYDRYNYWFNIAVAMKSCCNSEEDALKLFIKFSKRSKGNYCGKVSCINFWNSLGKRLNNINCIKSYAKEDSPVMYKKLGYRPEKPLFKPLYIKQRYLLDEKECIMDRKTVLTEQLDDLMNNKMKYLAIKSCYGSGKTTMVKRLIKEYDIESVLFVTYRQSLSNSILGDFEKLHFKSYLDRYYDEDRQICQYESLNKVIGSHLSKNNDGVLPSYDLVILDEIEGILNHAASDTIRDRETAFNNLVNIVDGSKRVIALDGDFHNRGFTFMNKDNECRVVVNKQKGPKRHFIFMHNRRAFDKDIDDKIKKGKNVCIVSMSSTIANFYNKRYKEDYDVVIHTSRSDDKLKDELKNVEELWAKYQIVIYSPSVEAGVNFDMDHFDHIFVVLATMSCSQRALMQMVHRVRRVKCTKIKTYTNGIPFSTTVCPYTFDGVKEFVINQCHKYLPMITEKDPETGKMMIKYKYNLWTQMIIYNEQETLNKDSRYFIAVLIDLLKKKGYTFTYQGNKTIEDTLKIVDKNKIDSIKDDIFNADDISYTTYKEYMNNMIMSDATRDEKLSVEKFQFRATWGVTGELTKEFFSKHFSMTYKLLNLRKLIDGEDSKPLDFYDAKRTERLKIVKKLIKQLGFSSVNDKALLDRDKFIKRMNKVKKFNRLFNDMDNVAPLFGMDSKKIKTLKAFMGYVNSVLSQYGCRIYRKSAKMKINESWKTVNNYGIKMDKDVGSYV